MINKPAKTNRKITKYETYTTAHIKCFFDVADYVVRRFSRLIVVVLVAVDLILRHWK